VVLACRNLEQAEIAATSIRTSATGTAGAGTVEVGPKLDLADPKSISAFVTAFQKTHPTLDVLVNNAGMFSVFTLSLCLTNSWSTCPVSSCSLAVGSPPLGRS
jgi:NAD(P)-dependent dehydrogenase (short-subunit alcohol dehydrogenase family)